jgi:hypothetical protein
MELRVPGPGKFSSIRKVHLEVTLQWTHEIGTLEHTPPQVRFTQGNSAVGLRVPATGIYSSPSKVHSKVTLQCAQKWALEHIITRKVQECQAPEYILYKEGSLKGNFAKSQRVLGPRTYSSRRKVHSKVHALGHILQKVCAMFTLKG